MDLHQLQEHVDHRFDKLEAKLDTYTTETIRNTSDLTWIKGGVTIALTSILGILGYLVVQYLQSLR